MTHALRGTPLLSLKGLVILCVLLLNTRIDRPLYAQTAKDPGITLTVREMTIADIFNAIARQTGRQIIFNNALPDAQKRLTVAFNNKPLAAVLQEILAGTDLQFDVTPKYVAIFSLIPNADASKGLPLSSSTGGAGGLTDSATGDPQRILDEVIVTGFQQVEKRKFTGAAVQVKGSDVKIDGMMDISRMLEGQVAGVAIQNVSGTFGAAPKIRIRGVSSISGENKPLWVVDDVVLEDVVNISNDQLASGDANTLLGSSVAGLNADDIETISILKDASATALYGARAMNGVIVITTKKGKAGRNSLNYTGNITTQLKPSYNQFNLLNSADQMSVYTEMMRKGWLNNASMVTQPNTGVFGKMYDLINQYDSTGGAYGLANTQEARAAFLQRYARANTNWFGELFSNSLVQEHVLSLSSGNDQAQYYFSGGFYNDNGWAKGYGTRRYTANMRANYKMSERLSLGFISSASIREQTTPGANDRKADVMTGGYDRSFDINPYSYALNTSRALTAYDEKGELEYFKRDLAPFNIIHELDNNTIRTNLLDFKLQGELNYKITRDLQFTTNAVMRYVKASREQQITEYANAALAYRTAYNSIIRKANILLYSSPDDPGAIPEIVLPKGGFYNRYENSLKNFNIRNQLAFNKTISADHAIRVLVGQEVKYADRQDAFNKGFGYQYGRGGIPFTDYRFLKQMLEQGNSYYGMQQSYDRFAAYFSNVNYMYQNKYILNGTLRYDGTNRLGGASNSRWLPTWTIGAAWIMNPNWKFRASYGLTASMGDATNSTVLLANGTTRRPRLSETESMIEIASLENEELTWEKQYSANLGADASLLHDKITVSADIYQRKSFDLISTLRTSGVGGQAYKVANYADMQSHGFELAILSRQIERRDWGWSTNFTIGYNKGKITQLRNVPSVFDLVIPEGGALYDRPVRGLYSIQFASLSPENGMPQFINEKGVVSSNVYLQSNNIAYLKYEGAVDPTLTGGLRNTFRYKSWELSFLLSYQAGNKVRLTPQFKSSYTDVDAMPYEFLNRWTLPGDEQYTQVPSILSAYEVAQLTSYPYSSYNYSTARVADGSFVRVKTITVSYRLMPRAVQSLGLNNVWFSVTGTNLWLLYADKKLQGQDPEFFTSGGIALPMPRQITASLKVGL